jgi:hypothetical protein
MVTIQDRDGQFYVFTEADDPAAPDELDLSPVTAALLAELVQSTGDVKSCVVNMYNGIHVILHNGGRQEHAAELVTQLIALFASKDPQRTPLQINEKDAISLSHDQLHERFPAYRFPVY